MSFKKMPSEEKIEELLNALPVKLDKLLERCLPNMTPYVPDYLSFDEDALALLKPFFEYSDAEFHEGDRSSSHSRAALAVFSKKKCEFEQSLAKFSQEKQIDRPEAIRIFLCFKLLFHFFESMNTLKVVDLNYQAQLEIDPQKRKKILDEAANLIADSSTGLFWQATQALHSGDLDTALDLCDQAIAKFPENTPAYELKANILSAKAEKALNEGLSLEPRDIPLQIAHRVTRHLQTVREKYASGSLTLEEAVEAIEQEIPDVIQRTHPDMVTYEVIVRRCLTYPTLLDDTTLKFLCTGEWLLSTMPQTSDHAASAIEFCKAVETELIRLVFQPFRGLCLKLISQDTETINESRILIGFVYKGGKLTLGEIAMIFQFLGSDKLLRRSALFQELIKYIHSFPQPQLLLGESGIRSILTLEAVQENRNSAAHSAVFSMEKARRTRSWCYSLINMLVSSKHIP